MKLTEFIAECQKLAEKIPDAEVLVDGWPVTITSLPAYYDGPSRRYDPNTNTLVFTRSGAKVVLHGEDMEELDELYPGLTLDTSALPDWQAERYHTRLAEARKLRSDIEAKIAKGDQK